MVRRVSFLFFLCIPKALHAVFCRPLSEEGAWTFSSSTPPEQGAWVSADSPCTLRRWDLRDRAVAFVGDSVSRFMFTDLVWRMLSCPALRPAVAPEHHGMLPDDVAIPAQCTVVWEFMYKKMKSDLTLIDETRNATLAFIWLEAFSKLHEVASQLWGPAAPQFDAIFMNAGLWDVRYHRDSCAAMPSVAALLAELKAREKTALVAWTTVFSEPVFDDLDKMLNTARFPSAAIELANACMLKTFRAASIAAFNATAIVRAPSEVLARLPDPHSRPYLPLPPPGALLTLDGFHPNARTRALLLEIFENAAADRWAEGVEVIHRGTVRPRVQRAGQTVGPLAIFIPWLPTIVVLGSALLLYAWLGMDPDTIFFTVVRTAG